MMIALRVMLVFAFFATALAAAAPTAEALDPTTVCPWGTLACGSVTPPSGSTWCEEGWSSGGAAVRTSWNAYGSAGGHAGASYSCLNWSNYGENLYQTVSVSGSAATTGRDAFVSTGVTQFPHYDGSGGGPSPRTGCWTYASVESTSVPLGCGNSVPAPWTPVLSDAFRDWVAYQSDCAGGSAPVVEVCGAGANGYGALAEASFCDNDRVHVDVFGLTADSREGGAVGCLVFD